MDVLVKIIMKEKNNFNEDSLFPDVHSSQNDEIMTLNNNVN